MHHGRTTDLRIELPKLRNAVAEGESFSFDEVLQSASRRAAFEAWMGRIIDLLRDARLGNSPHDLAVKGRKEWPDYVSDMEDMLEEGFEESRALVIEAAKAGIRVIEEMYEDQPIEPPTSTHRAAPTERPRSTMSEYDLTETEKDVLRRLVQESDEDCFDADDFYFAWTLGGAKLLGCEGKFGDVKEITLDVLESGGFLHITKVGSGDYRCSLRPKAHKAVESNFGAVVVPEHPQAETQDSTEIEIFISHSSKDDDIGNPLVKLLQHAFTHKPKVRYTSADETGLDPGALVDRSLKNQVRESRAFIGLLTPNSLKSVYVLFELGARWGIKDEIILLLAKGARQDMLFGPLRQIHAIECNAPALHRMLERLKRDLNRELDNPSAYQEYVDNVVEANEQAEPEDEDQAGTQLQAEINRSQHADVSEAIGLLNARQRYVLARLCEEYQETGRPVSTDRILNDLYQPALRLHGKPSLRGNEIADLLDILDMKGLIHRLSYSVIPGDELLQYAGKMEEE